MVLGVRSNGWVRTPVGLERADHVCWTYRDPREFLDVALGYVADGLMLGERVLCVVDQDVREALLRLDPSHLSIAGTSGPALTLSTVDEAYDLSSPRTPAQQLAFYDAAAAQALADGYTGLRVLAEGTALVTERSRWSTQLRWEMAADKYLSTREGPTALCAYRSDLLAPEILDDLSCVHPLVRSPGRQDSFRLFFDAGRPAIAGVVTGPDCEKLRRLLPPSADFRSDAELDLGLVREIDRAGARVLADWAAELARGGTAVRLHAAPDGLPEQWDRDGLAIPANVTLHRRS